MSKSLSPYKTPKEIIQFFSLEGNTTLLIKGSVGTGKTIFALECLKTLQIQIAAFISLQKLTLTLCIVNTLDQGFSSPLKT